jgi:hypothetical protein
MIESSHQEEMISHVVDGMGQRAFQQGEVCRQAKRSRLLVSSLKLTLLQSSLAAYSHERHLVRIGDTLLILDVHVDTTENHMLLIHQSP